MLRDIGVYTPRPEKLGHRKSWPTRARDLLIERSSRVVCVLFLDGLGQIGPRSVSKLNIMVNSDEAKPRHVIDRIFEVHVAADIADFTTKSLAERAEFILDVVCRGVRQASALLRVSNARIKYAADFVRQSRFVRIYESDSVRANDGSSKSAKIVVTHSASSALVELLFMVADQECARRRIAETIPIEFSFVRYLGKIVWARDASFCSIVRRDGKVHRVRTPSILLKR